MLQGCAAGQNQYLKCVEARGTYVYETDRAHHDWESRERQLDKWTYLSKGHRICVVDE